MFRWTIVSRVLHYLTIEWKRYRFTWSRKWNLSTFLKSFNLKISKKRFDVSRYISWYSENIVEIWAEELLFDAIYNCTRVPISMRDVIHGGGGWMGHSTIFFKAGFPVSVRRLVLARAIYACVICERKSTDRICTRIFGVKISESSLRKSLISWENFFKG